MSSKVLEEAGRVMTICNSCRYCEGFCAVFPAMELRRTFTSGELKYLANLCHNCRDCYYACQYMPPHEFDLNFPKAMAELRLETYQEFVKPKFLAFMFRKNGLATLLITLASIALVYFTALVTKSSDGLFGSYTGPNSFYAIIPYGLMVAAYSLIVLLVIFSFWFSVRKFWQETAPVAETLTDRPGNLRALKDALTLKYLEGGGHGCNYPTDEFSFIRRYLHHLIFYGFGLCFVATTLAAIYDHLLGRPAPYPFFSLPVLSGTIGGILIVIGTAGMLHLKTKMDTRPNTEKTLSMDISFNLLLMLSSLSGLILLIVRDTHLMGTMLILHLGLVLAFFITMPFGKFIHAVFRYITLVRNAQEQKKAAENH